MPTLYVSDLDGTLLKSDKKLSEYTCRVINELTEKGMIFSYATARSLVTAKHVTKGLEAKIPLVVYNGCMVRDNVTGNILLSCFFSADAQNVLEDLISCAVYPIVYSIINGEEKFSFVREKCSKGALDFIYSREKIAEDKRPNPVDDVSRLMCGRCFYFTCIDSPHKLKPLYEKYKEKYRCIYQKDIYSGEQWLEIMPKEASKANAVMRLKEMLGCDKVVAFGDGENDSDMFAAADECYAVENAVESLKKRATAVIGENDDDAVAKWLVENFKD